MKVLNGEIVLEDDDQCIRERCFFRINPCAYIRMLKFLTEQASVRIDNNFDKWMNPVMRNCGFYQKTI